MSAVVVCPGDVSSLSDGASGFVVSCTVEWETAAYASLDLMSAQDIASAVFFLLGTAFVFRVLYQFTMNKR